MQNLLDLNQSALAAFFAQIGEKPSSVKMRAKQTLKWLHQSQVADFGAMTDIAKTTRDLLAANAVIQDLSVIKDSTASDGTRKWLLDVGPATRWTRCYIPEDDRGTLCISSQAAARSTARSAPPVSRALTATSRTAEIVGQLAHGDRALHADWASKRTVGGSGTADHQRGDDGHGRTPANSNRVVAALELMLDDNAYGLSRRRVTVSTSGLVPQIDESK